VLGGGPCGGTPPGDLATSRMMVERGARGDQQTCIGFQLSGTFLGLVFPAAYRTGDEANIRRVSKAWLTSVRTVHHPSCMEV
jgi:hypothetical protein